MELALLVFGGSRDYKQMWTISKLCRFFRRNGL